MALAVTTLAQAQVWSQRPKEASASGATDADFQKRRETLRAALRTQDAGSDVRPPRQRTLQERAELREQLRRHKVDASQ
jgi:hypothetical protein